MIIFPTDRKDLVQYVLMHPDILPTIVDDTYDGGMFEPNMSDIWLAAQDGEDLVGLVWLHWFNGSTLQVHFHILKDYRKTHAKRVAEQAMQYVAHNIPRCKKVVAFVPQVYSNVRAFALGCGFEEEGSLRSAFTLNGKLHDLDLLGWSPASIREV